MKRNPYVFGVEARKQDKKDGYMPNGSVSVDTLAQDAFAMYVQDDVFRGTDREWDLFFRGYCGLTEEK